MKKIIKEHCITYFKSLNADIITNTILWDYLKKNLKILRILNDKKNSTN